MSIISVRSFTILPLFLAYWLNFSFACKPTPQESQSSIQAASECNSDCFYIKRKTFEPGFWQDWVFEFCLRKDYASHETQESPNLQFSEESWNQLHGSSTHHYNACASFDTEQACEDEVDLAKVVALQISACEQKCAEDDECKSYCKEYQVSCKKKQEHFE